MNREKFQQATDQYNELKARLNAGMITVSDLKQALKKLMIVDEDGHYWMIGGKSGLWYRHDGTQWIQQDPPLEAQKEPEWESQHSRRREESAQPQREFLSPGESERRETPAMQQPTHSASGHDPAADNLEIQPDRRSDTREADLPVVTFTQPSAASPHESKAGQAVDESTQPMAPSVGNTVNCRVCDAVIPADAEYCSACGANQNEIVPPRRSAARFREVPAGVTVLQVRSINPISMLYLLGGLGLIIGVVLGAAFGTFPIMGDLIYQFPRMLQETRGKIQGGLIFGVLGGIIGFLSLAVTAVIASGLYNVLAELFGGIRIRVRS